MKDHVGNVRVVYGDYRIDEFSDGNKKNDKIVYSGFTDYYPYGLAMDNRQYQGESYLFGFQGMEQEPDQDETQYHTLFRQYDAVLGRWWSSDPEQQKFPSFSPYLALGANPVNMVDPLGDFVIAEVGDVSKGGPRESRVQEIDIRKHGKHLVPVLKKLQNYVEKNTHVLNTLVKFSGKTPEEILSKLEFNEGPKLFVVSMLQNGFEVKGDVLLAPAHLDNPGFYLKQAEMSANPEEYERKDEAEELSTISTLLHEFGHTLGLKDEGKNNAYQMEKAMFGLEGEFSPDNPPNAADFEKALDNGTAAPMRAWEDTDENNEE